MVYLKPVLPGMKNCDISVRFMTVHDHSTQILHAISQLNLLTLCFCGVSSFIGFTSEDLFTSNANLISML